MGQRGRPPRANAEDVAQRQSVFREVNERIEEAATEFELRANLLMIVCECGNDGCREMLRLTTSEYKALRRSPTRFAVVPGHEIPAVERVVAGNERFATVEKLGDAGRTAAALDPRRDGSDPGGG